jgi:ADP-ribose pyrophosphatase
MDAKKVFDGERILVLEREGWQYVERKKGKSAVAVIAMTDDGKVVLTEQYRRPVDARVIDWPAGLVGDEEGSSDPAKTAKKELKEETGFTCANVERLTSGPTSPGITSEIVHLYRATGLRREGAGGGVGNEDITVHEVPLDEIKAWLTRKTGEGLLIDLKIWAGLRFLT